FLYDPSFKRSVVLLVEHNAEGSLGFILNKKVDLTIEDALDNFPAFEANLYFGGPVSPSNLFFIHSLGEKLPNSKFIMEGLHWGGDFDALKFLVDTNQVTPDQVQFFAGYSGWSAGQLEEEWTEKSWIVADTTASQIMEGGTKDFWGTVLKGLGKRFAVMANFPEDPSLN
ncbi:MAG: YqgE/AlgH family protein, partial [Bacteroidota bacterium]